MYTHIIPYIILCYIAYCAMLVSGAVLDVRDEGEEDGENKVM